MQIFNFRAGHVATFRHPSETSAKCLVTDSPDKQKAHCRVSAFHRYYGLG